MAATKPSTPAAAPAPAPVKESQTITSADIGSVNAEMLLGGAQAPEAPSTPTSTPPGSPPAAQAGLLVDYLIPVGSPRADGSVQTLETLTAATDAWMAAQVAAAATPLPGREPEPDQAAAVVVDANAPPLPPTIAEPVPEGEVRVPVGFLEENDTRLVGTLGRHEVDPERVVAYSPRAFTLVLDDHTPVPFVAGRNENVQLAHVRHWYAAAQGVRPVQDGE